MDKKYVKIGQIQWLLFFCTLIDHKFVFVWVCSLMMDNHD